jgi:hypothetical protein
MTPDSHRANASAGVDRKMNDSADRSSRRAVVTSDNDNLSVVLATRSSAELTHPKYRADIDGLRAVAVLLVLGFHAFPSKISGGFVGVDVFFVISGFLISGIIFSNLESNSFTYREFQNFSSAFSGFNCDPSCRMVRSARDRISKPGETHCRKRCVPTKLFAVGRGRIF